MIFNCIEYHRDTKTRRIHPTQKGVQLLEFLIKIFTDEGDVVIDPCAGSGSTLLAADNLKRKSYGFEIKKDFYKDAIELLEENKRKFTELSELGYAKTEISKINPILF